MQFIELIAAVFPNAVRDVGVFAAAAERRDIEDFLDFREFFEDVFGCFANEFEAQLAAFGTKIRFHVVIVRNCNA